MTTTERSVGANGLRFRVLMAGPEDGDLALLLHGFPEGAESWAAQLEALAAAGLWAVAPDLRGYGGTDCPDGEDAYRITELVADVHALVAALGRERCHLAGHDWGAMIGWEAVAGMTDRYLTWSALSVGHPRALAMAIGADEDQRRRSTYVDLFRSVGRAERVLAEDGYRRLLAMYRFGPNPHAIPAERADAFVAGLARPGRLTAALGYYRANLGEHAGRAFPPGKPVTVPTQLLWGDEDPALGREMVRLTEGMVAGPYRLLTLAGAGHWLQFERPDEVSAALVAWMREPPGLVA